MVEQINVFLENRPGRLRKIIGILKESSINIRAAVIQDRGDFGIMKLVVSDPVRAQLALSNAGLAAAIKHVIAVELNDEPGGLFELTEFLDTHGINIIDAYGFVITSGSRAVFCIEVEKPESVEPLLRQNNFKLVFGKEIHNL